MKLVSVAEMKAIEAAANASGLGYEKMMQNAGLGLAREIESYAFGEEREVFGLVGPGNNGGDTLVALKYLQENGWQARAYLVGRKPEEALVKSFAAASGEVTLAEQDKNFQALQSFVETAKVVVDGVLGTGVKLPLKPEIARVLDAVNQALAGMEWPPYVIAVDCPSGVDCDSGEVAAEVVPASLTVCMAAVKHGLLKFPASDYVGDLRLVEIGLDDSLPGWQAISVEVAEDDLVLEMLPDRPADSHKGTFGTALVVAGSARYPGAAYLSAKAAYRSGAGLVQVAAPGQVQMALAGQLPEATWLVLPNEGGAISAAAVDSLNKNLDRATALLVGPGLGDEEATGKFIEHLLTGKTAVRKPVAPMGFVRATTHQADQSASALPALVIDADGLRLLAKLENWPALLPEGSVLTPHPGEMAALTGLEKDSLQQDRLGLARKFAAEWKQVLVLKGAFTVIADPSGRAVVIPVASSALAHAGSGDVLAGLIVGLRAQGLPAFEAAVAGAYIHAQAGLLAADHVGSEAAVLASDLLDSVGEVLGGF